MRFVDIINPLKWWSFIHGYFLQIMGKKFYRTHIIEQYFVRLHECHDCVVAGKCKDCGCAMPAKAWVPNETCSEGHWGAMMEASEWEAHKQKYNIKFFITYGK